VPPRGAPQRVHGSHAAPAARHARRGGERGHEQRAEAQDALEKRIVFEDVVARRQAGGASSDYMAVGKWRACVCEVEQRRKARWVCERAADTAAAAGTLKSDASLAPACQRERERMTWQ
jgi:hypothetical protein